MSGRGASAPYITAAGQARNCIVHLVEIVFQEAIVRLTDAVSSITFRDQVYYAFGHSLEFTGIEEVRNPEISKLTLALSGVDRSMVALVLSLNYIDRPVTIYRLFLDNNGAAIGDCSPLFRGRTDSPSILEDPDAGTCTVAFSVSSVWGATGRHPGRHTNDEEQQIYFPGDKGFEFTSQLVETTFMWGLSKKWHGRAKRR
ncbi:MAG: hypothetical protein GY835_05740 [bacterium]|nr:hypothetical protein [bacterium]